jgi:hypothetical protein
MAFPLLASALVAFGLPGGKQWHRYLGIETTIDDNLISMSNDFVNLSVTSGTYTVCIKAAESAMLGKVILPIGVDFPEPTQLVLKLRSAIDFGVMELVEEFTRWLPNDLHDHTEVQYQYITVDLGLQFGVTANQVICMEYGVIDRMEEPVAFFTPLNIDAGSTSEHGWSFVAFGDTEDVLDHEVPPAFFATNKFPVSGVPPMRLHAVVPRAVPQS